jgi:hypothetical protein
VAKNYQSYLRQPQQIRAMGSVSAIDSVIFRTLFGTEEIRQVSSSPNEYGVRLKKKQVSNTVVVRFSMMNHTSDAASTRKPRWRGLSRNAM